MACPPACWISIMVLLIAHHQAALTNKPRGNFHSVHRGDKIKQLVRSKTVVIRKGMGSGGNHAYKFFFDIPNAWQRTARKGMVASFWLRFDRNFEWGCRGKIFVGPGKARDGQHSRNGASHRLMWSSVGDAYGYVYVPSGTQKLQPFPLSEKNKFGTQWLRGENLRMDRGAWVYAEIGVKLNTFGRDNKPKSNGKLSMQIDKQTYELRNVIVRIDPDHILSRFAITVFHGGGCKATKTSTLEIRSVTLFEWKE